MRKILSILMIGVLAVFASCDKLNELPEFNNANAFVAFEKAEMSIDEDGGQLRIPVTLASLEGKSATITYEVVSGTAKLNVNYTLTDPTATLNFDAENRTQYIVINIVNVANKFDGDLKFDVRLSDEGAVRPNNEWICKVTINDLDHPLAAILGKWNMSATSYFNGAETSAVEFTKDAKDVTVVWISNFVKGGTSELIYGTVNTDITKIKIPVNQIIAKSTSYPLIRLEGWYGPDGETVIPAGGYITIDIAADKSVLTVKDWFGSHVYSDEAGTASLGWYNIFETGAELKR